MSDTFTPITYGIGETINDPSLPPDDTASLQNTIANLAHVIRVLSRPSIELEDVVSKFVREDEEYWKACTLAILSATAHESPDAAAKDADKMLNELRKRREQEWDIPKSFSPS